MKTASLNAFSWGAACGAIGLLALAFGTGWLVTAGNRDAGIRTAWIEAQAGVCAAHAIAARTARGDTSDLSGFGARNARYDLATSFSVLLPGQERVDLLVLNRCSELLALDSDGLRLPAG